MSTPKSIYDLRGEWLYLLHAADACMDPDTGEYVDGADLDDAFARLSGDVQAKLAGCAHVLRRLDSDARSVLEEAARLTTRARRHQAAREHLEERVRGLMEATGVTKAKDPTISIALRAPTPRVEVTGELDPRWLTVPEPRPRLDEIKRALKAGEAVDGARLVDGRRALVIR